jgi:hypothetical protein
MNHHQGLSKDTSCSTSIMMHQSDPSKEEEESFSSSERRQLFATVASSLAALGGGFLLGASPATAATTDVTTGMFTYGSGKKFNKKIGGLANKIRGVCLNMVRTSRFGSRLTS